MAHLDRPRRSPLRRALPATVLLGLLCAALLAAAAAGCSGARGVPSGADLVTEATVKSAFRAPIDGMLYLYRVPTRGSRGQLHYSGPILAGQVLVIDPSMNKVTLDDEALEVVLPGGDVLYQAYFREDPSVRKAVAAGETRRRERGAVRELEMNPDTDGKRASDSSSDNQ
jgi:hypothetical protein